MNIDLNLPAGVTAEEEKDVLGGGNGPVESGVYPGVMELVYLHKNDKGTNGIMAHFKKKVDDKVVKINTWISTKADSAGNVRYTYKDKKTGEDKALPGYSQVNSMFLALTGKPFDSNQPTAEKVIKLYDYKAKKELPTTVTVFTDTVNIPIAAAILKISEEKTNAISSDPNNPPYSEGTGEFRDYNEFAKFFDAAGLTYPEKKAGELVPVFLGKWKEKNTGKTKLKKAKIPGVATGAVQGTPKAPTTVIDPFST